MTDDIVTRLRRHCHTEYPMGDGQVFRLKMPLLSEAADEIERLRAERLQWFLVARQLRDALFGTEEKDAAVDEYLRTRGRLKNPRE